MDFQKARHVPSMDSHMSGAMFLQHARTRLSLRTLDGILLRAGSMFHALQFSYPAFAHRTGLRVLTDGLDLITGEIVYILGHDFHLI